MDYFLLIQITTNLKMVAIIEVPEQNTFAVETGSIYPDGYNGELHYDNDPNTWDTEYIRTIIDEVIYNIVNYITPEEDIPSSCDYVQELNTILFEREHVPEEDFNP